MVGRYRGPRRTAPGKFLPAAFPVTGILVAFKPAATRASRNAVLSRLRLTPDPMVHISFLARVCLPAAARRSTERH